MIKIKGKNNSKYTDALIYSYVYSAREYSNNSIKHFFELLDLDSDLFNHLYNIDIIIDFDNEIDSKSDDIAYYEDNNKNDDNSIIILSNYISKLLDKESKIGKKNIIKDIGETIIHETLHSNRDLILKNNPNRFNIDNLKSLYLLNNENKKIYDECSYILNNYYNKCYKDKYIIILKVIDKNDYIEVYLYDKIDNKFKIYDIEDIKFEYSFDLYSKISSYLDKYYLEPIKSINCYDNNIVDDIYGIINLYTFDIKNHKDIRKSYFFLNYQYALEEALIEALTLIVSYHKNKNNLDIKGACEDIKYRRINDILKNGCNIFEYSDTNFIKQFLLSCYNDEYVDILSKVFNDKYIDLIKYFSILFEGKYEEIINNKCDNKINEVITQKLVKNKKINRY